MLSGPPTCQRVNNIALFSQSPDVTFSVSGIRLLVGQLPPTAIIPASRAGSTASNASVSTTVAISNTACTSLRYFAECAPEFLSPVCYRSDQQVLQHDLRSAGGRNCSLTVVAWN
ncbi:hypothetical protein GNP10_14600 [Escherichia coli]|nr:hypothetical protein [Escherichia coli]